MHRAMHGVFRPIHGVFQTHRGLDFVTYSGENRALRAPCGGMRGALRSLSGGCIFRSFALRRAPR